jgi:hypothetical protein
MFHNQPTVDHDRHKEPVMKTNFHICPVCGSEPLIDHDFCGGVVIWCDNDDCTGTDIQAWDKNPAYAAEKWEQRCWKWLDDV